MAYVNVDVEVEVSTDEFLSSCNPKEIQTLIRYLKEDGYLKDISTVYSDKGMNYLDEEWLVMIDKMSKIRQQMDSQDIEIIKLILNKY
jgi:hypothetical protein